jgi:hypothetical protein
MSAQDAIRRAQEAVAPRLLAQPGVTGVGVGLREKAGKLTDEIVIRVYVEKKRPLNEVPAATQIPSEIGGFKTDVIEKGPDGHLGLENHRERPIVSGLEISRVQPGGGLLRGTIGCFVTDKLTEAQLQGLTKPGFALSQRVYLLSASHVLNPSATTVDTIVYQPRPVGWINRVADTNKNRCVYSGAVDAGLAPLDDDTEWKNDVHDVGAIDGFRPVKIGETVWKQGITTGLTSGVVVDDSYLSVFPDTTIQFGPAIQIRHNLYRDPFANSGDSGGLVYAKDDSPGGQKVNVAVGLLTFASGSHVTACHIGKVFETLNVEWPAVGNGKGLILRSWDQAIRGLQGVSG